MRPFIEKDALHLRSQDLPSAYEVNGAFYLLSSEDLRKNKSFYSDDMVPLVIESPEEKVDIDTDWDWKIAEMTVGSFVLLWSVLLKKKMCPNKLDLHVKKNIKY